MVSFLLGHPVYKALSSKTRCHVKRLQVVVKYSYEYKIFMRNIGQTIKTISGLTEN